MAYTKIVLDDISNEELQTLVGIDDKNIKYIEELFNISLVIRDNDLYVEGTHDISEIEKFFKLLLKNIKENNVIDKILISNLKGSLDDLDLEDTSYISKIIAYKRNNQPIKAKTLGQYNYLKAIRDNDITFAIGPAGSGKTYLAVVMAVQALKNDEVKKIVLTRPAVEAGESLGFLPGDLKEKVDPYLMPLYDALNELLGSEKVESYLEKNTIEIIPLAYMRGRTLNDAFIILDEAQNTTGSQMLMFLTRLGLNSRMVVTGDITQIDLNIAKAKSGLKEAFKILKDIDGIRLVELKNEDIVRNHLVQKIIERYDAYHNKD